MVCVSDNKPIAVDKNKLLLPPNYTHYFVWGFPDYSARTATVDADRVSGEGVRCGECVSVWRVMVWVSLDLSH